MKLLPSSALFLGLSAAAPLFLFGWEVGLAGVLGVTALAAWDAHTLPRRRDITVERTIPERIGLGGPAEVTIRLGERANRSRRVRVIDDLPAALERRSAIPTAQTRPGGAVEVTYRMIPRERGEHTIGAIHLRAFSRRGLLIRQWSVAETHTVLVVPGLAELGSRQRAALRPRTRVSGARRARPRGSGTSFAGLRDYVRGDDPRTIDWKATARRGQMIVRESEAERNQTIVLAIDAGRRMTERIGDRSRADYALAAALQVAEAAARFDDRVGVLVFGRQVQHFLAPDRPRLGRLADLFATIETEREEPDYPGAFAYLRKRLSRRALVLTFSDVVDAETSGPILSHLAGVARRHLPLLVAIRNPAIGELAARPVQREEEAYLRVAAEELVAARERALFQLRRQGVLVADALPGAATAATVHGYMEIKARGRL